MRHWITLVLISLFCTSSFAQQKKRIPYYELDVIKGLFFQPNTIDPYTGTAFEKFPNGKKKLEVPIKDGKIHGTTREWAQNGKKIFEATYENGVQVGKESQWYAIGKKKLEINYLNGKPDGICAEWYKNGKKLSEGVFKNGKEEGEHTWWFDNGNVDQKVFYKNGMAQGIVKNWFRSGELKLESEYKNGVQHGKTIEWYANGQKQSESFFKNGKEDGESSLWSKSGKLLREKTYTEGKLIKDKNYLSGSIYFGDGYAEVFNEMADFFYLKIIGEKVDPRQGDEITYVVEGRLLQVYNKPIANYAEDGVSNISEIELLEKYIEKESEFIGAATDFEIEVKTENRKTASGKEYIYWSFISPQSKEEIQKPHTVQEEHYLSMICGSRVLSLFGVRTKNDRSNATPIMLQEIAETVTIEKERIDINALTKNLLNKK